MKIFRETTLRFEKCVVENVKRLVNVRGRRLPASHKTGP
jgi:hypothetical protein